MTDNLFSVEGLQSILSQITDIDSQLAAKGGSEAQQRKAAIEAIASENADVIEKAVAQFVKALEKVEPGVVAGVLERFPTAVSEQFQTAIDGLVAEKIKAAAGTDDINPETLKATRKELAADFDSLKRLLVKALPDDSEQFAAANALEVPKSRRSSTGTGTKKSGKNKEGYRYAIDGKDRPNSQNAFSSVAYYATEGCPTPDGRERWTTDELKEFVAAQGVKFGEDDTWSVTLPNNKVVSAKREAAEEEAPEEAPATDAA